MYFNFFTFFLNLYKLNLCEIQIWYKRTIEFYYLLIYLHIKYQIQIKFKNLCKKTIIELKAEKEEIRESRLWIPRQDCFSCFLFSSIFPHTCAEDKDKARRSVGFYGGGIYVRIREKR